MICLRCGYCCKKYAVVVVDDPEKVRYLKKRIKARKNILSIE